ncbi:MAG: bifunctional diguanylate cyclase/phosphodiesterase, partial [Janthinobacterium lividum]
PRVDALTRAAARLLHVPIVLVALVDEHRQWFKSTVGCFSPGDQTSRDVAFCAHAILEPQQLLVVEDASKDPRFCDNPLVTEHPGIRFYAGAPLLDDAGLPLGIFCIIDTVPRQISADDLETLRDLAAAVSSTLELHRSVVDLREAAEHHRAAVELSPHLQWSASPEGQNLEFSSHTAALMGFSPEEMLGSGWQKALHPDDLAGARQRWATSLRTGEIYESEHRLSVIDGTYRWFRAHAAPRRDSDGRIVRWYGVSEDNHDRKLTELALRESEEHYRFAMEASPQVPWTARPDGLIEEVSPRLSELTGLSRDAILARGWAQFTHPDDQPEIWQCWARSAKTGDPFDVEYRIRVADGRYRWFHVRAYARRDGSARILRWYGTAEDITMRREDQARIMHLAHHDALTGLANRVLYRERVEQVLAEVAQGERLALLCVDLDNFKAVNDTLGHAMGDTLLRLVAQRLRSCVRATDLVCRFGGDEFVILQTGVDQPDCAGVLATRLVETISAPYELNGNAVVIGATVGVAVSPDHGTDAEKLFQKADAALCRGKRDGRGSVRFFEPELDDKLEAKQALRLDLRHALERDELEVFYQPLVDTRSGRITSCEALLRWHHPRQGLVPPDLFIPLAEETGMIGPIGDWVLIQACRDAASWPADIKVAVNLSPVQFREVQLAKRVTAILDGTGLSADRLELEITESVLLAGSDANLVTLRALRDLGVGVALDDFGTGYSSLACLHELPIDCVKIDRSFVAEVQSGRHHRAVIKATVMVAKTLGLAVVAEGVETKCQHQLLRRLGCTHAQGFLLGRPISGAQLLGLVDQCRRAFTAHSEVL